VVGHWVAGDEAAVNGVVVAVLEVVEAGFLVQPLPLEKIRVFCQRAVEVLGCVDEAVGVGVVDGGEGAAVPFFDFGEPPVNVVLDLFDNSTTGVGNCNDISLGVRMNLTAKTRRARRMSPDFKCAKDILRYSSVSASMVHVVVPRSELLYLAHRR
jgi:hypothetical protein